MKYKTLFRLVLKLIGVYLCAQATINAVPQIAQAVVSYNRLGVAFNWSYSIVSFIGVAIRGALGLYLFFGGKWIVDHAIPANRPYCPECGYDLTGAVSNRCSECDTPFRNEDVRPPRGFDDTSDKQ